MENTLIIRLLLLPFSCLRSERPGDVCSHRLHLICLLEQLLFSVVFGRDAHTQRDTIFNHWPPPEESEPLFLSACSENPHGAVCWLSMLRVTVNLLNNNRWKERLWKWLIVSFHMLPILGFVLLVQTDCPVFLHSSLSFLIISVFHSSSYAVCF